MYQSGRHMIILDKLLVLLLITVYITHFYVHIKIHGVFLSLHQIGIASTAVPVQMTTAWPLFPIRTDPIFFMSLINLNKFVN